MLHTTISHFHIDFFSTKNDVLEFNKQNISVITSYYNQITRHPKPHTHTPCIFDTKISNKTNLTKIERQFLGCQLNYRFHISLTTSQDEIVFLLSLKGTQQKVKN